MASSWHDAQLPPHSKFVGRMFYLTWTGKKKKKKIFASGRYKKNFDIFFLVVNVLQVILSKLYEQIIFNFNRNTSISQVFDATTSFFFQNLNSKYQAQIVGYVLFYENAFKWNFINLKIYL